VRAILDHAPDEHLGVVALAEQPAVVIGKSYNTVSISPRVARSRSASGKAGRAGSVFWGARSLIYLTNFDVSNAGCGLGPYVDGSLEP